MSFAYLGAFAGHGLGTVVFLPWLVVRQHYLRMVLVSEVVAAVAGILRRELMAKRGHADG